MDVSIRFQSCAELTNYSGVEFVSELDSRFRCPVCNNPLKDPVQTGCGHRMCSECLQKILRSPNLQCPIDKEVLSPREVFKDVFCRSEILDLICFCNNRKHGCEWQKELLHLEEHLNNCEYREVPCQNEGCEEMILMKKLSQHMKESCLYKQSTCQYCREYVPEIKMEAHFSECKKLPITCQYCGMTNILREDEASHIENECTAAEKPCKFKYVGCSFKGNKDELDKHYDSQTAKHLKQTLDSMNQAKKGQEELKGKVEKAEMNVEKLEKQLAEHREELAANPKNSKTVLERKNAIAQLRERTEAHFSECKKLPLTCQYCGMTNILREDEASHIENECTAAEKPCKFKYVGCSFKGNKDELDKHYNSQMAEHLKQTLDSMNQAKKGQEELKGKVEKAEIYFEKLEKQLAEHREELAANSQNSISYVVRLRKVEKTLTEQNITIAQLRERTKAHFSECNKLPITCQYCGMTNILREDEASHIENECTAGEKACKFKYVGCSFKGNKDELDKHYDHQMVEHLKQTLLVDSMNQANKGQEELKERVEKAEMNVEKLEKQLAEHREELAANSQNLILYVARLRKAEKTVLEQNITIAQLRERTEEAVSSKGGGKSSEVSMQIDELRSAFADQEKKLLSFERELQRSSVVGGGLRSLGTSSLTLDRRLDRNDHQLALRDIQLAEHDLKIQMLEATSYDGTYIWKIDEFSRRNHEGIIGKTPSIYSPPFYVGRNKGEYDALLPWPFRQNVTSLLDQDRQQDVTDTFRPDPNSSSFKRPTSNMNIVSGCPLFVSQQLYHDKCPKVEVVPCPRGCGARVPREDLKEHLTRQCVNAPVADSLEQNCRCFEGFARKEE